MILCHCNTVDRDLMVSVIEQNLETIQKASSLLEAVGVVWRKSVDEARDHRNPFSCTSCFKHITGILQKGHHLFEGEKLPSRNREDCANCPRLGQCRLFEFQNMAPL